MIYRVHCGYGFDVYCEGEDAVIDSSGGLSIKSESFGGHSRDVFAPGQWERCHKIDTNKTLGEIIGAENAKRAKANRIKKARATGMPCDANGYPYPPKLTWWAKMRRKK